MITGLSCIIPSKISEIVPDFIGTNGFFIETENGQKSWAWREFSSYYETPGFFHLYFDSKSFFLIPKDAFLEQDQLDTARKIFREHIKKG